MGIETVVGEGDSRWEEIAKNIRGVISGKTGLEANEISYDARFSEDLSLDSLDVVEAVMGIEDRYEISIPDAEAEKLLTLRIAADYVYKAKYDSS